MAVAGIRPLEGRSYITFPVQCQVEYAVESIHKSQRDRESNTCNTYNLLPLNHLQKTDPQIRLFHPAERIGLT